MGRRRYLSNRPARIDLVIQQGATFGPLSAVIKDKATGLGVDLTGCAVAAQIRKTHGDPSAHGTFTVSIDVPTSTISWSMAKAETQALDANEVLGEATADPYYWDLELTWSDGSSDTPFAGEVRVPAEVTKA